MAVYWVAGICYAILLFILFPWGLADRTKRLKARPRIVINGPLAPLEWLGEHKKCITIHHHRDNKGRFVKG